jgi:hypothetical protein
MYCLGKFLSLSLVYGELIEIPLITRDYGVYADVQISGAWGPNEAKKFKAKLDITSNHPDTFQMHLSVGKTMTTSDIMGDYSIKNSAENWQEILKDCKFTRIEKDEANDEISTVSLGPLSQVMTEYGGFAWRPGRKVIVFGQTADDMKSLEGLCGNGLVIKYAVSENRGSWSSRGHIDIIQSKDNILAPSKSIVGISSMSKKIAPKNLRSIQFSLLGSLEKNIVLFKSEYKILKNDLKKLNCNLETESVICENKIPLSSLPKINYLVRLGSDQYITWLIEPEDYISDGKADGNAFTYTTSMRISKTAESIVFPRFLLNQQTVVLNKSTNSVGFCLSPDPDIIQTISLSVRPKRGRR